MSHCYKKTGSSNAKTLIATTSPNQEPFEIRFVDINDVYFIENDKMSLYKLFAEFFYLFQMKQDIVRIPLDFITPKYYSETGYRFTKPVTAFYIRIEE